MSSTNTCMIKILQNLMTRVLKKDTVMSIYLFICIIRFRCSGWNIKGKYQFKSFLSFSTRNDSLTND